MGNIEKGVKQRKAVTHYWQWREIRQIDKEYTIGAHLILIQWWSSHRCSTVVHHCMCTCQSGPGGGQTGSE